MKRKVQGEILNVSVNSKGLKGATIFNAEHKPLITALNEEATEGWAYGLFGQFRFEPIDEDFCNSHNIKIGVNNGDEDFMHMDEIKKLDSPYLIIDESPIDMYYIEEVPTFDIYPITIVDGIIMIGDSDYIPGIDIDHDIAEDEIADAFIHAIDMYFNN